MRPFRVQRETVRKCVDENNRTFNIGSDQNIYFFYTVESTNNKAASNCGGESNSLSVVLSCISGILLPVALYADR